MTFTIKAATPINERLLIAIAGPAASGKTTSALRLATGITQATGGKICVIDTENKRALQYAAAFKFNHIELDAPFAPARYDEAVQFAEKNGYGEGDVIIIDSMSHEHEGPGGVLEIQDDFMKSKNYNQGFNLIAWNHAKKGRKRFIFNTLQRTSCHVILCFRAKEGLHEAQVNGKKEYIKTGLEPVGEEQYFYEMKISLVLPLGSMGKPDWTQKLSRINEFGGKMPITDLLKNRTQQISEETGKQLAQLTAVQEPAKPVTEKTPEQKLAGELLDLIKKAQIHGELQEIMEERFVDFEQIKENSQPAYDYLIQAYNKRKSELAEGQAV